MLEGCFEYPRGKETRDGWGSLLYGTLPSGTSGWERRGSFRFSVAHSIFFLLSCTRPRAAIPLAAFPGGSGQIWGGFRAEVSGAAQPGHGRTDGRAGGRTGGREDVRLASPSSVFASWEGAPGAGLSRKLPSQPCEALGGWKFLRSEAVPTKWQGSCLSMRNTPVPQEPCEVRYGEGK